MTASTGRVSASRACEPADEPLSRGIRNPAMTAVVRDVMNQKSLRRETGDISSKTADRKPEWEWGVGGLGVFGALVINLRFGLLRVAIPGLYRKSRAVIA